LTGQPPFEGDDVEQVLGKVKWGEFNRPRQLIRWIDPALEAVCLKAMAFMPEDRYQTARGLADDIEHWTAGQPVTAWDEPLHRRLRRWARRAAPAAMLISMLGLVALAIASSKEARTIDELRKAGTVADFNLSQSRDAMHQAQLASDESEASRRRAEAAAKFLTGLFRRSEPKKDGGEQTAANLLDRAAGELAKARGGADGTQEALLMALGESYLGLGMSGKADPLFLKAYEGLKASETEMSTSSQKLLADAGPRIVALYDAAGEKDKADAWRKRLAEAALAAKPKN
jgi:hypothetical protein